MTRRRVVFIDSGQNYYITPELNGDKTELETFRSTDSCDKTWEEIKAEFLSCSNLAEFFETSKQAQMYYHSALGTIGYEPVQMISPLEYLAYERNQDELLVIPHKT